MIRVDIEVPGKRLPTGNSSTQAPIPSLPCKHESSYISLCLLSPQSRNALRGPHMVGRELLLVAGSAGGSASGGLFSRFLRSAAGSGSFSGLISRAASCGSFGRFVSSTAGSGSLDRLVSRAASGRSFSGLISRAASGCGSLVFLFTPSEQIGKCHCVILLRFRQSHFASAITIISMFFLCTSTHFFVTT